MLSIRRGFVNDRNCFVASSGSPLYDSVITLYHAENLSMCGILATE